MLLRVESHRLGPRLFVGPLRIHHWHWGTALVLASTQLPPLAAGLIAAGGLYLIAVDRHDLPGAGRQTPMRRSVKARTLPRFDPEIGVTTSNVRGRVW